VARGREDAGVYRDGARSFVESEIGERVILMGDLDRPGVVAEGEKVLAGGVADAGAVREADVSVVGEVRVDIGEDEVNAIETKRAARGVIEVEVNTVAIDRVS